MKTENLIKVFDGDGSVLAFVRRDIWLTFAASYPKSFAAVACGKCLRELYPGRECPKCARHPWKLTRKVILAGMIVFIIIGVSLWANYLLGLK